MSWQKFLKDGERSEVRYYDTSGNLTHIMITKDRFRETYYLLEVSNGKRKEIGSSNNPLKLEKKIKRREG